MNSYTAKFFDLKAASSGSTFVVPVTDFLLTLNRLTLAKWMAKHTLINLILRSTMIP